MKQTPYQEFIGKAEISFWFPIITSVVLISLSFASLSTRLALVEQNQKTMIDNQKELLVEFRSWKSQAEVRLGMVESRQNTVISYMENHLGYQIIK